MGSVLKEIKKQNSFTNSADRIARDTVAQGGRHISQEDRDRQLNPKSDPFDNVNIADPVSQINAIENQFYQSGGLTDAEVEGINNARSGIGFNSDISDETLHIVQKQIKDQAKADAQKVYELQKKKAEAENTVKEFSKAAGNADEQNRQGFTKIISEKQKLIDEIDKNIKQIESSNLSATQKAKAKLQLAQQKSRLENPLGFQGPQRNINAPSLSDFGKSQNVILGSGNVPSLLGGINTITNKETNPFLGLTLEKQGPLTPSQQYQNRPTLENSVFIPGSLSYLLGDKKPLVFSESRIIINPQTQKLEGEFLTKDKFGDKTSSLELAFGSFIKGAQKTYLDYYNTGESLYKFANSEKDITPTKPAKTIINSAFGGVAKAVEDSRLFNVPLHETLTAEYKAFTKETGKKAQNDPFGVAGEIVAESLFFGVTAGVGALASGIAKGSKAVALALKGNPNQKLAQSVGNKIFQTNTDKALGIKLTEDTTKTKKLSDAIIKSNREIPVGVEKISNTSYLITAGAESKKPLPSILFNIGKNAKSTIFTPISESAILTPKNLIVKGATNKEFVNPQQLSKNIIGIKGTPENLARVSSPSISKFLKPEAKITDIESSLLGKYGKTIVNAVDNPKANIPYNVFATTERRNFIKGFASDVLKLPSSGSLLPKPKTNILPGNKNPFKAKPSVNDLFKGSKTKTGTQKQFNDSIRNIVKAESKTRQTAKSNPYGSLIGTGVYSSLVGSRVTAKPSRSRNSLFQTVRKDFGTANIIGINIKQPVIPKSITPQKPDTGYTIFPITTPIVTPTTTPILKNPPPTTLFPPTFQSPPTFFQPPPQRPPVIPNISNPLFFQPGGRGSYYGKKTHSATKEFSIAGIDLNINRKVLPGSFIKKSSSSSIFRELDKRQAKANKTSRSTLLFGGQVKTTKSKGKTKNRTRSFNITGSKSRSTTQRALGL